MKLRAAYSRLRGEQPSEPRDPGGMKDTDDEDSDSDEELHAWSHYRFKYKIYPPVSLQLKHLIFVVDDFSSVGNIPTEKYPGSQEYLRSNVVAGH